MKNKIGFTILIVLGIALGAMLVRAQSPTPDAGLTLGDYTVTQDAELGVRFLGFDGNFNKYRSDLNYGRGFRLFDYDFVARSKDGNGKFFDLFQVNALGWGGDPSEYLRIQVEKNKYYRFDSNIRSFDYFNDLTNLALNQHLTDANRRMGDFNLTLLPDNQRVKFYLGYTFDRSAGCCNSVTTYDYQRKEFPILDPSRSISHDLRLGFDAKVWVFDLSFMQGIRYFKDDTVYSVPSFETGNETGTSVINFLNREDPTRGRQPFTRFSAHTLIRKKLDFTGRFIYSSSRSSNPPFSTFTEQVTGVDASANNILLDLWTGSPISKRHNGIGDLGVTFFATDRLTVSDTFQVNDFQNSGGLPLSEALYRTRTTAFGTTVLPTLLVNSLSFRFLGYRLFTNTLEGDYKFSPWFSAHIGYRYNALRTDVGASNQPPVSSLSSDIENDHTNSIIVGFKARPVSAWTVYFDFEHGTADNPFTRVSNYDYDNFRVRTTVKLTKSLRLNASLVSKDNNNPSFIVPGQNLGVDTSGRIFSASADFTPNSKFTLTGGYTYDHLDSDASIIFYLNGVQTNGDSLYFMRDHYFFANTYIQFHPRVKLMLGYRINKDNGQGDRTPASTSQLISSYPLQYQMPEGRLSVKVREHIEWNAGLQYYDYKERFVNTQNYRATLPYTSLRFTF